MATPHPDKPSTRYRCRMCGYVYDSAVGDLVSRVRSGTPFEDLPDRWVCPVCGAGKELFSQHG